MNSQSFTNFFGAILALTFAAAAYAEDWNSYCQSGPDDLASIGGELTCIESTEFTGKRCFYTIIPECAKEDSPLVFDIHGYSSCPFFSTFYTGWVEKSNENCFVLVMPVGITDTDIADERCFGLPGGLQANGKTAWSCCCHKGFTAVVEGDDSFLRQVAAVSARDIPIQTANDVTIDTKRIYMAGHSNGCMASISMGTLHSDMVAAVGCHAGAALTPFPESYIPTPMFLVHGTADGTVQFDGSFIAFGAPTTHELISQANGCTEYNEKTMVDSMNDVTEYMSTSCVNNASVTLYALKGVGHNPYMGDGELTPVNVDTTQKAWDFMKQYSLETAPDLIVNIIEDPTSLEPSSRPSALVTGFPSMGPSPMASSSTGPVPSIEPSTTPTTSLALDAPSLSSASKADKSSSVRATNLLSCLVLMASIFYCLSF